MAEKQYDLPDGKAILNGNVALTGIQADINFLPKGMSCLRGIFRSFSSFHAAAEAVDHGEIARATALAIFSDERTAGLSGYHELIDAIKRNNLCGSICIITDDLIEPVDDCVAAFGYGDRQKRIDSGIGMLNDGDMLEYDVGKGSFNADITEEGYRMRLAGGLPECLVKTYLDQETWALTDKYSRMFVLKGAERCLLLDTAFGKRDLLSVVGEISELPLTVALTHGHWDHAGGIRQFGSVYLSQLDMDLLPGRWNDAEGKEYSGTCNLQRLEDGQILDLGERKIEVISCPGHTPGGLVFLDKTNRMLFAGDSIAEGPTYLFMNHCSAKHMMNSLDKIYSRAAEYDAIYASHRKMILDKSYITDMYQCIEGTLDGRLRGEPACIARTAVNYKKYCFGQASVFMP